VDRKEMIYSLASETSEARHINDCLAIFNKVIKKMMVMSILGQRNITGSQCCHFLSKRKLIIIASFDMVLDTYIFFILKVKKIKLVVMPNADSLMTEEGKNLR
jgi:hypothetical protein